MRMNNRQYLGFLGFLGFLGVAPLLRGDWLGALWLVWFLWFTYFTPQVGAEKRAGATQSAVNEGRVVAKHEALDRVYREVREKGTITNDEVEALLGVSDATAERYLEEIERAGGIEQVGRTGKTVSYRVKN